MRELSRRCAVYISSEAAPEDFRSVWHQDVQRTINRITDNRMTKTEHLFRYEEPSERPGRVIGPAD